MNSHTSSETITESPTTVKPAAIWARVSTHDQRETSLPSQIERCKEKLEQAGYSVIHTLAVDWTSLDLFSCPKFQQLRSLIRNREIHAVAVFDRDRLEAKGLQRLVFLSECKTARVEVIICQGTPILDEPEGQLVELALAIGKERQVLRARQGSRDGLHDRATMRGLPVTFHRLYGYRWDKGNNRLVPNDDWSTVKLIFDMLLKGSSYGPIIRELKGRDILSPSGQPEWNKAALSSFVHNPTYAGRYYALKKQSVEPKKRKGDTYGNSSVRKIPLEEAHYISQIKIIDPPITWDQRLQILDQLAKHQRLAQRNAKRDYLLRGMIFCETHRGKQGEPRRYHGQPHHGSWRYVCPVGGCRRPYLDGSIFEFMVKEDFIMPVLQQPDEFFQRLRAEANQADLREQLHKELANLRDKYSKNIAAEAKLEDRYNRDQVHPEVYQLLKGTYRKEREWIQQEEATKLDQLAQLGRETEAVASLEEIRKQAEDELWNLTNDEWREILTTVNFRATIMKDGGIDFRIDVPLPSSDIASAKPEPG